MSVIKFYVQNALH